MLNRTLSANLIVGARHAEHCGETSSLIVRAQRLESARSIVGAQPAESASLIVGARHAARFYGVIVFSVVVVCWLNGTALNLKPWQEAGRRMTVVQDQIRSIVTATPADAPVLFANLPTDYKGAGMIGRPELLRCLARPPFLPADRSSTIAVCDPPGAGAPDVVSPSEYISRARASRQVYVYSNQQGLFVPVEHSRFENARARVIDLDLDKTALSPAARTGDVQWLPVDALDPLQYQCISIELDAPQFGTVQLVWRAPDQVWWQCADNPMSIAGNKISFTPARLSSWTFANKIEQLGLRIRDSSVIRRVQISPGHE
jgi:hypothetical protein